MTSPLYPLSPTPAPALTDEITLQTTLDCLIEHLPIETQGYWSIETIFEMLVHAASRGQSLEQTTRGLQGGPSSNDLRYHLNKYDDMAELQSQLNTALQSRIPSGIRKGKQRLAIDLYSPRLKK
jgi:putative transposase